MHIYLCKQKMKMNNPLLKINTIDPEPISAPLRGEGWKLSILRKNKKQTRSKTWDAESQHSFIFINNHKYTFKTLRKYLSEVMNLYIHKLIEHHDSLGYSFTLVNQLPNQRKAATPKISYIAIENASTSRKKLQNYYNFQTV